jgi:hypothetical protein
LGNACGLWYVSGNDVIQEQLVQVSNFHPKPMEIVCLFGLAIILEESCAIKMNRKRKHRAILLS